MRELKDPNANTNGINGHTDTEHATSNIPDSSNAWSTPGSAAFDFRSTVPTSPRPSLHLSPPPTVSITHQLTARRRYCDLSHFLHARRYPALYAPRRRLPGGPNHPLPRVIHRRPSWQRGLAVRDIRDDGEPIEREDTFGGTAA